MSKKVKLVSLKGGKDDDILEVPTDRAVLILDGEAFFMDSFVISGETKDESGDSRFAFAYNASVDQQVIYKNALNVQIDDLVRNTYRK